MLILIEGLRPLQKSMLNCHKLCSSCLSSTVRKVQYQKGIVSFLLIFSLVLLSGCGKSPFLKMTDKSSDANIRNRETLSNRVILAFPNRPLKVEVLWPSGPVSDELLSAYLIFFDSQNQMVDPPNFYFEPTMPDMGHGTSPVLIFKISQGLYKIDEIFFSMPGRWQIEIGLKDSDKKESAKFEINI